MMKEYLKMIHNIKEKGGRGGVGVQKEGREGEQKEG